MNQTQEASIKSLLETMIGVIKARKLSSKELVDELYNLSLFLRKRIAEEMEKESLKVAREKGIKEDETWKSQFG